MSQKIALQTILYIAIAGVLFSGYLSYQELFLGSCSATFVRCGNVRIADLPACVYGFVMYAVVIIISSIGLAHSSKQNPPAEM